jgi:hypothetical protein
VLAKFRALSQFSTSKYFFIKVCEKSLASAAESTGRRLHKCRFNGATGATFIGEGRIAISIEKLLLSAEGLDERVIKPSTTVINYRLAITPTGKMRQFVQENMAAKSFVTFGAKNPRPRRMLRAGFGAPSFIAGSKTP